MLITRVMLYAQTHKFQLSDPNVHSLYCNRSETFCLTTEVWLVDFSVVNAVLISNHGTRRLTGGI